MIEQTFTARGVALLARLTSATALGIAFGVLTLWLQSRLTGSWSVFGNSGAVWTVVAVLVAAALGASVGSSAAAGVLALLGEVAGFYWFAVPWNGIAITHSEQLLWCAAALVIGPFAGLAGWAVLRGSATHRVVGLLSVSGVLFGEGGYLARQVPAYATAAHTEIALGVAVGLFAVLLSRAPLHRRAGAVLLGMLVAGVVLTAYTAPTLVL